MRTEATLEVSSDPACVAAARHIVGDSCGGLAAGADVEAMQLMVSEIVTNVIRHTPTGDGQLRVLRDERTIRIEVQDQGAGVPSTPLVPDRARGGGFGLYVVDRLSDRWGVQDDTCIWFEMDLSVRPPSASSWGGGSSRFQRGSAGTPSQHAAA